MSANDKEALDMMASDWAKDHDALTARIAELEDQARGNKDTIRTLVARKAELGAEREGLYRSERRHLLARKELEAEVERLKRVAQSNLDLAWKAEAEVENLLLDYATVREAWAQAEAKLADVVRERDGWKATAESIDAKWSVPLAEVEKQLTLICEFTQEHGDWSLLPAGKVAARVHNMARAALASLEETP